MGLTRLFGRARPPKPEDTTPRADLTHEQLAHERRVVEQLAELDRRKNEFLGSLSHELRTPVASVLGYTELLLDGSVGPVTDEQRTMLLRIDRQGRRLHRQLEDLIILSEIVAGEFQVERRDVDLTAVVRRAVEVASPALAERHLALHVSMRRLPVLIRGDAGQLERVVVGLLTNAEKFTPEGGKVTLTLAREGEHCVLTVRDTGVGIAEEDLDQAFNSFFRSSAAYEQAVPGTGLGLAVAKSIVEIHEGSITVDSRLGHGTTVTVRLRSADPAPA